VTTRHVVALDLVPFQIRRFQLIHASTGSELVPTDAQSREPRLRIGC
jgi:hypothetical protein